MLSGHTHQYERVIRDDDGDATTIPYVVTGLGGAEPAAFDSPVAGSVARYNAGHGTLVVEAGRQIALRLPFRERRRRRPVLASAPLPCAACTQQAGSPGRTRSAPLARLAWPQRTGVVVRR